MKIREAPPSWRGQLRGWSRLTSRGRRHGVSNRRRSARLKMRPAQQRFGRIREVHLQRLAVASGGSAG